MLWVVIIEKNHYFIFQEMLKAAPRVILRRWQQEMIFRNSKYYGSLGVNILIDHSLEIHEWNSSLGPSAMEIYVSYASMQSIYLILQRFYQHAY